MMRILSPPARRRAATCLAAAMLSAGGGSFDGRVHAQDSSTPIGIVDAVSGRWLRVQDRQPLTRGQLLYTGQTITIGRANTGAIRIVLFAGNERWELTCSERAPCAGTYRPAASSRVDRGFWAFLSSFWNAGQQLPPVLAGSRSVSATGPAHAFIRGHGSIFDLRPALADILPGRYSLRLFPAPGSSLNGADRTYQFSITLRAGDPVEVTSVPLGLYLLSVTDEPGQTVGSTALVLLRDESDDRLHAIWSEARENATRLTDTSAATRAALLAQTLYTLDARRD